MNATQRMESYLVDHQVPYEVVTHDHTATSLQTAHAAGVDAGQVAKAVLLEGDGCMLAALVPADQDVRLGQLAEDLGRHVHLADELTIRRMFSDCDPGAMPGLPMAWGVETIWDDALLAHGDIYLEAGDHERLIHLKTRDLEHVLADMSRCHFCGPRHAH